MKKVCRGKEDLQRRSSEKVFKEGLHTQVLAQWLAQMWYGMVVPLRGGVELTKALTCIRRLRRVVGSQCASQLARLAALRPTSL